MKVIFKFKMFKYYNYYNNYNISILIIILHNLYHNDNIINNH